MTASPHTLEPWLTLECEAAHYVDQGKEVILCDRLPRPITLVVKLAGGGEIAERLQRNLATHTARFHGFASVRTSDVEASLAALCASTALPVDVEEQVEDFLNELADWESAYPLSAFPEPDLKKAAALLKAGGMTLDAISASNMRHVVSRLAPKARAAISAITAVGGK